jgi:twitching motility protein PilU
MIKDGVITQEEGLANADSATNLLWLINNTQAGAAPADGDGERQFMPTETSPGGSFSDFKLDVGEERASH